MNDIKLTSQKRVSNFGEPYIIAELAANHNGDMELAKKMIQAAKECGANCVKFQSWSKDSIMSKRVYAENRFLQDDYRNRTDYTLEQIVEKFSISEQQLLEMKKIADTLGIDCTSTPFSPKEVDFLVHQLKAPFIKVASMDLNNYPFLEYIARQELPIVISTGLSELSEIDKAIRTMENAGNKNIVLLHCVSIYPPEDAEVNLNNIETFQKLYPYPIGFSDHTIGYSIPLAAVAKGACVIEKHFTLDKNMFGWDHKISANAEELSIICKESKRIQRALGSFRIVCEENNERKSAFRRSIVTTRNMKQGEILKRADIDFKRPGTSISPGEMNYVVGRTLKRAIACDELIQWEDLV